MQAFEKIEWVEDRAWLPDFSLRYSLYSSLDKFDLETSNLEILIALLGKS